MALLNYNIVKADTSYILTFSVIQDREVYSGALDDSDYEEPIQEEVIQPSKVRCKHHTGI